MKLPSLLRRFFPPETPTLAWVTSDLAVGPAPHASAWPLVHAAGVRCVLDLRAEATADVDAVVAAGLMHRYLAVADAGTPSRDELEAVVGWVIERISRDGPVLIHCREGRGRSPFVAAAVLVRLGLPLPEAYRLLQRARPELALSDAQVALLESFWERR